MVVRHDKMRPTQRCMETALRKTDLKVGGYESDQGARGQGGRGREHAAGALGVAAAAAEGGDGIARGVAAREGGFLVEEERCLAEERAELAHRADEVRTVDGGRLSPIVASRCNIFLSVS
ncbi:hypothetical protein DFH09DRAFT_1077828 [Mycena vulgaris]|nr:hypothetical protein DFH09DRAFT_1077828 [Mycena vulgaris]